MGCKGRHFGQREQHGDRCHRKHSPLEEELESRAGWNIGNLTGYVTEEAGWRLGTHPERGGAPHSMLRKGA